MGSRSDEFGASTCARMVGRTPERPVMDVEIDEYLTGLSLYHCCIMSILGRNNLTEIKS